MADLQNLAPIRIEYPPGSFKRDEPTAGGTGPHNADARVQAFLTAATSGSLPLSPTQSLIPFPNTPDANLCYRNAALTLLLNLKPFINYLQHTPIDDSEHHNSLVLFRRIASIYWDQDRSFAERISDLQQPVSNWFRNLDELPAQVDLFWDTHPAWNNSGQQADTAEFLDFFLDRIQNIHLTYYPAAQQALDRLMRFRTISRRVYYCSCHNKQRRPYDATSTDANLWLLSVNADRLHTPLQTLLANRFYSPSPNSQTLDNCPTCGAQRIQYDYYWKFKWFPEIFFIGITYQGNNRSHDTGRSTTLPDMIDLSYLEDYQSTGQNGDSDARALYQLQGIVMYDGYRQGRAGHFYTCVRRPDNTWATVDEMRTPSVMDGLDQITSDQNPNHKPRLLAYVRVRSSSDDHTSRGNIGILSPTNPPRPMDGQPPSSQPTNNGPSGPSTNTVADDSTQTTQPRPQLTANQAITIGGLGDLPPDNQDWDAQRMATELQTRHVYTYGAKLHARLRAYCDRFRDATVGDRLGMLTKQELLSRATAVGLDVSDSDTRATICQRLLQYIPQSDQQSPTSTASTAADVTQSQPAATVLTTTARQSSTPATSAAATVSQNVAAAAISTTTAQITPEAIRLTAEYTRLHQQLRNSQRARDAATGYWLDVVLGISNYMILEQAVFSDVASSDSSSLSDVVPRDSPHPPSGAPANAASNTLQFSQIPASDASTVRFLEVTTVGVIDSLTHGDWDNHIAYLEVPGYFAHRHLLTTQWWYIENYSPAGSVGVHRRVVVNVAIRDQVVAQGQQAGHVVYRYTIDLGAGENLHVEPIIITELRTLDEMPVNVRIVTAPIPPSTIKDFGELLTGPTTPPIPPTTIVPPSTTVITQAQTVTADNPAGSAPGQLALQTNNNGTVQTQVGAPAGPTGPQSLNVQLASSGQTILNYANWQPDWDEGELSPGPGHTPNAEPAPRPPRRPRSDDDQGGADQPNARRRRLNDSRRQEGRTDDHDGNQVYVPRHSVQGPSDNSLGLYMNSLTSPDNNQLARNYIPTPPGYNSLSSDHGDQHVTTPDYNQPLSNDSQTPLGNPTSPVYNLTPSDDNNLQSQRLVNDENRAPGSDSLPDYMSSPDQTRAQDRARYDGRHHTPPQDIYDSSSTPWSSNPSIRNGGVIQSPVSPTPDPRLRRPQPDPTDTDGAGTGGVLTRNVVTPELQPVGGTTISTIDDSLPPDARALLHDIAAQARQLVNNRLTGAAADGQGDDTGHLDNDDADLFGDDDDIGGDDQNQDGNVSGNGNGHGADCANDDANGNSSSSGSPIPTGLFFNTHH